MIGLSEACVDFPELPPVAMSTPQLDQMINQDLTAPDLMVMMDIDHQDEAMLDRGPLPIRDATGEMEMSMVDGLPPDQDPLMPEMSVAPENFKLTPCQNGVIEGSERRFINGQMESAPALPCRLEGSAWLRVDPVSEVPFYATNERAPNRDQGVGFITTQYTYFLMQREVDYKSYQEHCVHTELLSSTTERIDQAACRAPSSLPEVEGDKCSSVLQTRINELMSDLDESQLPMNCVPWEDAGQFCRRIGGRLPTEVEWEIAGSYGRTIFPGPWPSTQRFDSGLCQYANIKGSQDELCKNLHPLELEIRPTCWGSYNPWPDASYELCDMSGNVAEWIMDDWSTSFDPQDSLSGSPVFSSESADGSMICSSSLTRNKVIRGGSANQGGRQTDLYQVYLTSRRDGACDTLDEFTGFRCVISSERYGVTPWTPNTP